MPAVFSERISRLKGSLVREILAAAQRPEVMSFAGGLPAESLLPRLNWDGLPDRLGQYGSSEGEPVLREKIAEQARGLGIDCQAEQVLILNGSQQALDLASKLFIDPGTPVLLEQPSYLAALQCFELFGAHCLGVPLNADGLDLEVLEAQLKQHRPAFIYLIPTFQNPSGVRYSEACRAALASLLDTYEVTLIEDEPYRELVYDEQRVRPVAARLARASWIYCGSLSKTLVPGMRVGYLIASPDLYLPLLRLKQAADLHSNRLGQWQALQWLGTPQYQAHLETLRDFYRSRRDAMQQRLQAHFADLAEWQLPAGGLFFWLRLHKVQDTRRLLDAALAQNVAFMPGEPFFTDPDAHPGYLRLNFSHVTPERLDEGVGRLAEVVRRGRTGNQA